MQPVWKKRTFHTGFLRILSAKLQTCSQYVIPRKGEALLRAKSRLTAVALCTGLLA